MLELSALKAIDGSVHCQVKNMKIGEPNVGFTLYEGPIELALTNLATLTFRATRNSLLAAYDAFKFMRKIGLAVNHTEEIDNTFKTLVAQNGVQPIMAGDIIDKRFLPAGITELLYPGVQIQAGTVEFIQVMLQPRPTVRKNTLVLYLENGTVVCDREQVLYYKT